jgi:hypothetical protein
MKALSFASSMAMTAPSVGAGLALRAKRFYTRTTETSSDAVTTAAIRRIA